MPDSELLHLDVLGPSGPYRSRAVSVVSDVRGVPVAELSLAPVPYVSRAMSALHKAPVMPREKRLAALVRAAEIFSTGEIAGLGIEEHQLLVSRISGLGISVVRAATEKIRRYCAEAYADAQSARPGAAVDDRHDARADRGTAVWVRRGDVFGVHAAGNHPAVHADWIEALALGYRVAVRPSRREPLTPYRLVSALRQAGFGDDQVVFLPSDYDAADEMLRGADRSLAYGGDDVVRKYGADPRVRPQGPGRSKILVTASVDWRDHLDLIADSVSRGGGTGCTNTTAVFVDGDAAELAAALAERLGRLPNRRPEEHDAILPVQPVETARALEARALAVADGSSAFLDADGIVHELGDGTAVLRPAVFLLPDASAPQARVELPFPCVWVAPWTPEQGSASLRDTLVLTALTDDDALIDAALQEPTVRNVYIGAHPTYWNAADVPHDGYLADFLMESKGLIGR